MRRHRITAAALSAVATGLGQIYNRQYAKGAILFLLYVAGIFYASTRLGGAIWGLVTLGETKQQMKLVGKVYVVTPGDHSIFLMVEGLIVVFAVLVFVAIHIGNVADAYRRGKEREEGKRLHNIRETFHYVLTWKFPFIIITLPLLFVFFFSVLPILFSVLIAFTNYSSPNYLPPANLVDWIGFDSFKNMFSLSKWTGTFYGVLGWTIVWAVVSTATTFFGGFAVALLVQQKGIRLRAMWRTIFMLPFAIPAFLSLLIIRNMFNSQFGPINQYLGRLGITGPEWMSDPIWAKVTVVLANMWLGFPISMLLIIGILTTIPRDLYEAADVDGASPFQKFKAITLPSVMFALSPILIGQFAGNINNFNVIFLMTGGGPVNSDYQFAGSTDILITWLYNLSISNGKYNFASVVGIILFLIIASLSIHSFRRTRAFREDDLLR